MCTHLYASGFRFYRKQCIPNMVSHMYGITRKLLILRKPVI